MSKKSTPVRSVQKARKSHNPARRKKIWSVIRISIATAIAAAFAIMFLLPIILTISNSFMSATEISANYGSVFATTDTGGKVYISEKVNLKFIPDMVSFSQYITVLFKSPEYLLKFWNSVILVGPIVLFQLIVASFASYGFARYTGRLRQIVFFTYIILMLMPYQVTLVPNYLVSEWLNLLDSYWAIWLPGIFSPFAVYLLTKFMRRIPVSVIEAAQIDGAGEWQIYRRICMPLCRGALCSAAILVFIDYWNMVEQPLILLSDAEKYPLSVFLSKINAGEIGLAFAVATIYMIPSLLVFLYGEEYLVDGITYQGGIKG
uniref:carbohydrate ABC transporter permease n=1 Tax=Acetatifactor sp. TaxID=1872090 RepID=UPI00405653BD